MARGTVETMQGWQSVSESVHLCKRTNWRQRLVGLSVQLPYDIVSCSAGTECCAHVGSRISPQATASKRDRSRCRHLKSDPALTLVTRNRTMGDGMKKGPLSHLGHNVSAKIWNVVDADAGHAV